MSNYTREDVSAKARATTRRMIEHLIGLLADEPSQDAGGHPSIEVHQQVGAAWADWDRQRRAWQALLAPRLLREAMDNVRGGPDAEVALSAFNGYEGTCPKCGEVKFIGHGPLCIDCFKNGGAR